jgi:hypothetical protein
MTPATCFGATTTSHRGGETVSVDLHRHELVEPRLEPLLVGSMLFPIGFAPRLLRGWRNFTRTAPEGLSTTFRILRLACDSDLPEHLHGRSVVCVQGLSVDPEAARRLEEQLRFLARPLHGGWVAAARARSTPLLATDGHARGDGLRIGKLDDWAIETFLRLADERSPLLCAELRHEGGRSGYRLVASGVAGAPATGQVLERHLDRLLTALTPWAVQPRVVRFPSGAPGASGTPGTPSLWAAVRAFGASSSAGADGLPSGLLARLGRDRSVPVPAMLVV